MTVGVALCSKVDARLCIGRSKAIPIIKNSKKLSSYFNCIGCLYMKGVKQAKMEK